MLTCVVLNSSCDMSLYKQLLETDKKNLSESDIRTTIENYSSVEEIQAEVDNLFSYYGDEQSRFSYNVKQVEIQALMNLADALNGEFIGVSGTGGLMDYPAYVHIRFNGHRSVQFLMIFKNDEDVSVIKSQYPNIKHIINNIYVR